jgi:hypothetical protein
MLTLSKSVTMEGVPDAMRTPSQPFRFLGLPHELCDTVLDLCLVNNFRICIDQRRVGSKPGESIPLRKDPCRPLIPDPPLPGTSGYQNPYTSIVSSRTHSFLGYEKAHVRCLRWLEKRTSRKDVRVSMTQSNELLY